MLNQQEIKAIFASRQAIITDGHFVYAKKEDGWYHGRGYVAKDEIYPYTSSVQTLCREIALYFADRGIQTVVGPTVGAVSLSQWTAHWLSRFMSSLPEVLAVCADEEDILELREILIDDIKDFDSLGHTIDFSAVGNVRLELFSMYRSLAKVSYSEKVGTKRVIKRGYGKHVKGKRCLIVEDVLNTGLTVVKTRDAVCQMGGEVVGVGALSNRSGGKVTAETLGVPELFSLLDVDMEMTKEDLCQECKEKGRGSVNLELGKGKEFLARVGIKPGEK